MKWIETAREVVRTRSFAYVDLDTGEKVPQVTPGAQVLDMFTASGLVNVYDALNEINKVKFGKLALHRAIGVMWSVTGSKGEQHDRI